MLVFIKSNLVKDEKATLDIRFVDTENVFNHSE